MAPLRRPSPVTSSRAARPPWAGLLGLGAVVGALSSLWLLLLQVTSATAAGMSWSIPSPWLNAPFYAAVGAVAGAAAAPVLELLRRSLARGVGGWRWAVAWLALGGYATLVISYALVAGRGFKLTWGRMPVVVALAAVVLVLVAAVLRLLRGASWRGLAGPVGAAATWMAPTLAAVYFGNVLWVADRPWRSLFAHPAWASFAVFALAGLSGLAIGALLRAGGAGRGFGAVLLAALLAGGLWLQAPAPGDELREAPAEAPNVLLVVLDTLRRDAVSAYGAVADTTPNLDRLAAEGVLWDDAIVPGNWTIPGHASLFTGALVSRHGAGTGRYRLRERPAGEGTPPLPTLAEVFRDRGWRTVAFVANGQLNPIFGFARGFDEYYEIWRAKKGDYDALGRLFRPLFNFDVLDRGGDRAVRGLAAWLGRRGDDRPWLAFVNMTEPHSPYDVPEPWMNRFTRRREERSEVVRLASRASEFKYGGASPELAERLWTYYLGAVAYQDHLVGRILDTLAEEGLAEDTIVMITSDHGESFGWRGQLYHGVALNDDLIRVPLLARGPGLPPGVVEPDPVSLVDVLPTLLHLTGGEALRPDAGRPGRVMPPVGERWPERGRIAERLAEFEGDPSTFLEAHPDVDPQWASEQTALLSAGWKAVRYAPFGEPELSRRVAAPSPPWNDGREVVSDPQRLEEMLARLAEIRDTWPSAVEEALAGDLLDELDDETLDHLRALGYVE